jgi:hypothetical protein
MRKITILSLCILFLYTCSKDSSGELEEVNAAPSIPQLLYPTNNLLCTSNELEFQWSLSTDSNNDAIEYIFEISTFVDFSFNNFVSIEPTNSKLINLNLGTRYFWRVKSVDENGLESDFSPTFEFYTQGEVITNYLPFSPDLILPELGSIENTSEVELQWSSSDPDNNPLVYDVYIDTVNPPANMVSNNQSESLLNVNLTSNTTYFWRVIVRDDNDAETTGQVWNFSTN